jgi:hypothetical protein
MTRFRSPALTELVQGNAGTLFFFDTFRSVVNFRLTL